MNILPKLLLLLLGIVIVPLTILGMMSVNDIQGMKDQAVSNIKLISHETSEKSKEALNNLASTHIRQIAVDVAKQVEIYLRENPGMTVADLQNDTYFRSLAVQRVGKTGYTALTDVETLVCRFHSNPAIENLALVNLAGKLPGFWEIGRAHV